MQASIAFAATAIGSALATLSLATDNASGVKFQAVLDFATVVAGDVRREINRGSNLSRDAKGRFDVLMASTKDGNKSFKAALLAGGVKDKDAANIASLATTASRHFVAHMIEVGSLHAAESEAAMRDMIAESVKLTTGGAETYNALEQARSRKWLAPEPQAETEPEAEPEAVSDPFTQAPLIADTLASGGDASNSAEDKIASDYYASALFTLQSASYAELQALEGFDDFVAAYLAAKRDDAKAQAKAS